MASTEASDPYECQPTSVAQVSKGTTLRSQKRPVDRERGTTPTAGCCPKGAASGEARDTGKGRVERLPKLETVFGLVAERADLVGQPCDIHDSSPVMGPIVQRCPPFQGNHRNVEKGPPDYFKRDQSLHKGASTYPAKRTYCQPRTNRVQRFFRWGGEGERAKARGFGPVALPAFRIPTIRSTTHERRASSRRRIVHGQIEGP
jgi:hypothetical protein